MAKKTMTKEIDFESAQVFSEALSSVASRLDKLLTWAEEGEAPPETLTTTNWSTAVRGLDYIEKFVSGLASQAFASGSPRQVIDVLKLGVDNPMEILAGLQQGEPAPRDKDEAKAILERLKKIRKENESKQKKLTE